MEIPQPPEDMTGILKTKKENQSKKNKSVKFDTEEKLNVERESSSKSDRHNKLKNEGSISGDDSDDSVESNITGSESEANEAVENSENESESGSDLEDESRTVAETNHKEDIYGRLRDESGNIVNDTGTGSYIPPGRRLAMAKTTDQKKKIELERMNKKLKGLINR